MASRPLFLCLLCTIAALGSVRGVGVGLEFAREPAPSVVASKGKPLVLPCAAGDPSEGTSVSWLVNDKPVVLSERVVLQPNGSLFFRKIIHQPPQQSDEGLYQCKLSSGDGVSLLSQNSELRVAGMATNFKQSPKNISVQVGDSARLRCHIVAVPTPALLWERDGKTLPQDARYQVLPSGVLLIENAQYEDQGVYRCVASTKKNKRVSSDAFIEVVPADGLFRAPVSLADNKSESIEARSGDNLFLECGASGAPTPSLRWIYKPPGGAEKELQGPPRLGTNVLAIPNVTVDFAGVYICRATNSDANNNEHLVDVEFNISFLVAPTIKKSPRPKYPIAKTAKFDCEFEGMPLPKIAWYKNGEKLHVNGRIRQKDWTLVLTNTVKEDLGIYQCKGWNKAGEVWAAARLTELTGKQESSINVPNGLRCSNITVNSVLLSWDHLIPPVTAYTLHYQLSDGDDELQEVAVEPFIQIRRLKPFTNYTFYVRGYSKTEVGDASESIRCTTDESSPMTAPTITTLYAISPTSVKVGWEKLPPALSRGNILTHKVQYKVINTNSTRVYEIPASVLNYTISKLTPGEKYNVRVLSSTKAGWPDKNAVLQSWQTIEMPQANDTVPLAPDVKISKVNETAIKASWAFSKTSKIHPSSFKVSLLKNEVLFRGPFKVDGSASSYVFNDLDPLTLLMVQVQALGAEDEAGGTGFKVYQHSLSEDPEGFQPPHDLDATAVSANSIKLSWEGLSDGFFSVSCHPLTYDVPILLNSSKHSVLISNLKPYTTYELVVRMYDKNLNLGPSSEKIECQTLEDVPGPPAHLVFVQTNTTAGRVSWSAPSESNGKLRSYRIYYTPEELSDQPLDKWPQVSSNLTSQEITGLIGARYSVTVKASTQAGYGKAADFLTVLLTSSGIEPNLTDTKTTSHYTLLLAILCGAVAVLITIGVLVTLRLARSSTHRSPDHDIPHTNGNGLHHEGIDLIALSPNIPPASAAHLDTKGWYPTPKTNGAHSNGRVPNGVSAPLLTQVHITENPQFNSNGEGKNACPSCPGPGSNSRGCPSCQVEPLLAADVTQVTVLADD